VLLAVIVEVAVKTVTLPKLGLGYCCFCGARVCWFCSDCCWSL